MAAIPYSRSIDHSDHSVYLRSIDESVRTIKWIVVCWAVLTVLGFAIWLLESAAAVPLSAQHSPSAETGADAH